MAGIQECTYLNRVLGSSWIYFFLVCFAKSRLKSINPSHFAHVFSVPLFAIVVTLGYRLEPIRAAYDRTLEDPEIVAGGIPTRKELLVQFAWILVDIILIRVCFVRSF